MSAPLPPGGITASVLGPLLAGDPHRPRLIWHGAGRTELSTASLANWSAKTAGLLVDELGGRPGGVVVWRVRRSWQAVPLLLGSWWAGMVVTDLYDEAAESRAVAAFIDDDDDSGADEVIVASSHPFGLATGEISEYARHVADAVLPQADRFTPRRPAPTADSTAAMTTESSFTVHELLGRAARRGRTHRSGRPSAVRLGPDPAGPGLHRVARDIGGGWVADPGQSRRRCRSAGPGPDRRR